MHRFIPVPHPKRIIQTKRGRRFITDGVSPPVRTRPRLGTKKRSGSSIELDNTLRPDFVQKQGEGHRLPKKKWGESLGRLEKELNTLPTRTTGRTTKMKN